MDDDLANVACFRCGQTGHLKANCPQHHPAVPKTPEPRRPGGAAQSLDSLPGYGVPVPARAPAIEPSAEYLQARSALRIPVKGALEVPCPFCNAPPGVQCENAALHRRKSFSHPSRYQAAGEPDPWPDIAREQLALSGARRIDELLT